MFIHSNLYNGINQGKQAWQQKQKPTKIQEIMHRLTGKQKLTLFLRRSKENERSWIDFHKDVNFLHIKTTIISIIQTWVQLLPMPTLKLVIHTLNQHRYDIKNLKEWNSGQLKRKHEHKLKENNGIKPRQVAIFGLPAPLGIETIRPPILRTPKTFIQERAILGVIQRIALIPNPIPIKHITPFIPLIQKSWPYFPMRDMKANPMDNCAVIQVREAANKQNSDQEEAKNAQRRL